MNKMGFPKSEKLFSKIYSTSRIPGLFKFLQHSFKTNKLNEAQNTLADLENNVKVEIENLETDLYSIKKELGLTERAQGLLELEKLKLQDESRRSQRECDALKEKITSLSEDERVSSEREKRIEERYAKVCDELKMSEKKYEELKEKITRLVEDKKVSSDREKRTEEQYAKVCDELKRSKKECDELKEKNTRLLEDRSVLSDREKRTEERYAKFYDEHSKAENEKHKMILHLNERIQELKNQKLGSQQVAEMYREKIKSLDLRLSHMNWEVERLKREKSEDDQIVEELRCKVFEADQTVEMYKKKFEDLNARFGNAEQILAKIFKVGINDLSGLATNIDTDVNFSTCDGEKESSGNGGKRSRGNADFGNRDLEHFRYEISLKEGAEVGDTLPMVRSACKSSGTGINGLQERGGGNLVQSSQAEEAGANGYVMSQSSPRKQSACGPVQTEINDTINKMKMAYAETWCFVSQTESLVGNGWHATNVTLDHGERASKNLVLAGSSLKMAGSLKSGDIIEIIDSDDEATPKKIIRSPNLSQTNRKNKSDYKEGSLLSSAQKRKRRHEESRARGDQTPSQASDGIDANDCTDTEDESFSSSCINNMVYSLQGKKKSKA